PHARFRAQLEAPHVITEVRSRHQPGLREIHQVAIERRAVEAVRREIVYDVAVADWRAGALQASQHREARPRAAQPDSAEPAAQALDHGAGLGAELDAARRPPGHGRNVTPAPAPAQREPGTGARR